MFFGTSNNVCRNKIIKSIPVTIYIVIVCIGEVWTKLSGHVES